MPKPISRIIEQQLLDALAHLDPEDLLLGVETRPSVLAYHSISHRQDAETVQPREFARQVRYLTAERLVLPLTELLALQGKPGQAVALTFDDGYQDTLATALPILRKYAVTATVFVIGQAAAVREAVLGNGQRLMTATQIRRLIDEGWEVGYHGVTHTDLTTLNAAELEAEISEGKRRLEQRLGVRLRYFAYPYGRHSADVERVAARAGFQAAFTTSGGPLTPGDDPYRLGRIVVTRQHRVRDLRLLLTGTGQTVNRVLGGLVRQKDRRLKRQTMPFWKVER